MADERGVSEIVTKFLLNTCRLRPQLSEHGVQARHATQAIAHRAKLATIHPDNDAEVNVIPLIT